MRERLILMLITFGMLGFSCSPEGGGSAEGTPADFRLGSPDGTLAVQLRLTEAQRPVYTVWHQDSLVLEESRLGVKMEAADFTTGLSLEEVSAEEQVEETYEMVQGKRKERTYTANEKVFHLKNASGERMDIIFRVSDDGVAFRYHFPGEAGELKKISEEVTSFNFKEGTKSWLQPMSVAKTGFANTNPSYEEFYLKGVEADTASPLGQGWVFPALFQSGNSWVLVTETAPYGDYVASHLRQATPGGEFALAFPQQTEVFPGGALNPEAALPWSSPWRIITIGSLGTIVESTLGTDLAKPAVEMDQSFIQPGKASWSWVLLKDDFTVFDVQKEFIDYAADMNWEYTLVDAHWDTKIGLEKIKELVEYGKTKNVGILLWYNSAGSWNLTDMTPKDKLLTHESRKEVFSMLEEIGVKGVKVDFFGGDGQSMIQYYIDILEDAADHHLLVNFHGATLPRGWHRTYPHLMTGEAIKGMEFVTFEQQNADEQAAHSTVIPFARNVFDPMDFTPTVFDEIPHIERKTTNGFELALPVIFLSGIQHYAETPKGMATVPAYVKDFMRKVPVTWKDTRFIEGYPGKLAVIARKGEDGWYVAGINGENTAKAVAMDLSFLAEEVEEGMLITDGEEDLAFVQQTIDLQGENRQKISMKGNGGFVLYFPFK